MKKGYLIIFCLFTAFLVTYAQDDLKLKSPTVQYLIKRGYIFPDSLTKAIPDSLKKWPDKLYYNTIYTAKLLGTPTIPFNFTRIEYLKGKFIVSPTLSLGYGYSWFTGDFIFNDYDKIIVDPKVFFGLIGSIGVQSDFSLSHLANFFMGGFVGIGSFTFFAGYDFVGQSPSIGLGGRLDLYSIKQEFLKPIGKVREYRRHKSFAFPITYD